MKNLLNFFIVTLCTLFSYQKNSILSYFRNKYSAADILKEGKIMCLFFQVNRVGFGKERIMIQKKKITEGKLKFTPSFDRSEVEAGDLIVILSDSGGKEMIRQLVKNPLYPEMEVYEKEGVSRKNIAVDNAEFSVRCAYAKQMQMVKIEKVTEAGTQLLFTKKI